MAITNLAYKRTVKNINKKKNAADKQSISC